MTIPFSIAPSKHVAYGDQTFTTVGNTTWNVPEGVTAVSIVCVGGGGGQNSTTGGGGGAFAYANAVSVTPGEALTITVGAAGTTGNGGNSLVRNAATTILVQANGGSSGGTGGTVATGTGFAGGAGGIGGSGGRGGGGGGAGGYSAIGGAGGAGGGNNGTSATGGGGGGGFGTNTSNAAGGPGGGVNIEIGQGINGAGDQNGNGGGDGSIPYYASLGAYGGGAGGNGGGGAQQGVVKIVWYYPTFGAARSFPATKIINSADFRPYQVSAITSTSSTITVPAYIQAGDIAILFDTAENGSTTIPTTATPTNFTVIDNASISSSSSGRSIISYKVLIAGDASTTLTGMTGTNNTNKILTIWRLNQPLSPSNTISVTLSTPGTQATTGANPSNQTISMAGLSFKDCAIYAASYRINSGGTMGTRGATGPIFTEIANGSRFYIKVGDFTAAETSANATISMTASSASFQILQSFYILFSIS